MDLKEIRKTEIDAQVNERKEKVINAAFQCFCNKGIEATSINEIAKEAQIGVASVYRYFENKETIVLQCGKQFWQMAKDNLLALSESEQMRDKTALEKVRVFLDYAIEIYLKHRQYFCYLHDMDNFIISHRVEDTGMLEYEENISAIAQVCIATVEEGKQDGSITYDAQAEEIYRTVNSILIGVMEKMSLGAVIQGDALVEHKRQLQIIADFIIEGLKSK